MSTNTPTEQTAGIQLRDGCFHFPAHFKCRVDATGLREIPRKLDICRQGVEALTNLFYEAPLDQKELVSAQKVFWENVNSRILDMHVFNATASFTNLSNQLLPIKVILPKGRQYFPLDLISKQEETNPFKETKLFARELLDIVAAIKVLREDKVFGFQEFYIFPSREAFTVTTLPSGVRCLAVGIHSVAPEDQFDGCTTEQFSIRAIRDLIKIRYDRGAFKKVARSNSLNEMLQHLQLLSQDVPAWKRLTYGTIKTGVYAFFAFLIFSGLAFVSGLTPINEPKLEEISLCEVQDDGTIVKLTPIPYAIPHAGPTRGKIPEIQEIRIVLESNRREIRDDLKVKSPKMQVIGTFRSDLRTKTFLDQFYKLDYTAPIKLTDLKKSSLDDIQTQGQQIDEPKLQFILDEEKITDDTFRWVGRDEFLRKRFTIHRAPPGSKNIKGPFINVEVIVQKKDWQLKMDPDNLLFREPEGNETAYIDSGSVRLLANPDEKEAKAGETAKEKNREAYITFSFERNSYPMKVFYFDAAGKEVAQMEFASYTPDGKLNNPPSYPGLRRGTTTSADSEEEPEEAPEDEEGDSPQSSSQRFSKFAFQQIGKVDVIWYKRTNILLPLAVKAGHIDKDNVNLLNMAWANTPGREMETVLLTKGNLTQERIDALKEEASKLTTLPAGVREEYDMYYRLAKLEKTINTVKIRIDTKNPPTGVIKGFMHVIVPGISKPLTLPITIQADETLKFDPAELVHTRDKVTGFAYPITIKRRVWGQEKNFELNRVQEFTFGIEEKPDAYKVEGFSSFTLGLQLTGSDNKDKIYFYNPVDGETYKIDCAPKQTGTIEYFFTALPQSYTKFSSKHFTAGENKKSFQIRDAAANTTSQLYLIALTDKNVENASLQMKRQGTDTISLPITARSREALRIVQWQADASNKEITRYNRTHWIEKPVSVAGPLGALQYQAIIFSGEQPDKDVSSDVYIHIDNPDLVNLLYQTTDNDWFANIPETVANVKIPNEPTTQLQNKKFGKETQQKDYFRLEASAIGKIKRYLVAPGTKVKLGQAEQMTKIYFYYPAKDLEASLDVAVGCQPTPQQDWQLSIDNQTNNLKIKVLNYPRADAKKIAKSFQTFSTCTSMYLLHSQYHNEGRASKEDQKWAETIRWSLESIGYRIPPLTPTVLGKYGERLNSLIQAKNPDNLGTVYEMTREALLLAWSDQAQALLSNHLGLHSLENILEQGKSFKNANFSVDIQLQPPRDAPILVNEPERFAEITFTIPFDKLLMDRNNQYITQLQEAYYYNIPSKYDAAPEVTKILKEVYPLSSAFAVQDFNLPDSNIQISTDLYNNVLKFSLWEKRVNEFRRTGNKFYVAMLVVDPNIATTEGKIDTGEVARFSKEIEQRLRNYFLTEVNIRRINWTELKDKVRGVKNENRNLIGAQEQAGLLRYLERTMMSQYDDKTSLCWYTNFTFVVDQPTLDQLPVYKSAYLKTCQFNITKGQYEPIGMKQYLVRRNGMNLEADPSAINLKVEVWQDPNSGYNKFVSVKGITTYQDWFAVHNTPETKTTKPGEKRTSIKLYYQEADYLPEKLWERLPGQGGPPIVDFEVHPAAVLLYEISGYRVSADTFRQLTQDFSVKYSRHSTPGSLAFEFEQGPILVPFSFKTNFREDTTEYLPYNLTWKQEPAPQNDKRTLDTLTEDYDMDFVVLDTKAPLPVQYFRAHEKIEDIFKEFESGQMTTPQKTMMDFFNKLFDNTDKIPGCVKFRWNKDLADYYKQTLDNNQMFRYSYGVNDGHKFSIMIPVEQVGSSVEIEKKPAAYKGKDHPELKVAAEKPKMVVIWRVMPKKTIQGLRGFPKYILNDGILRNNPIFSAD